MGKMALPTPNAREPIELPEFIHRYPDGIRFSELYSLIANIGP